jgi:hypothetical protein
MSPDVRSVVIGGILKRLQTARSPQLFRGRPGSPRQDQLNDSNAERADSDGLGSLEASRPDAPDERTVVARGRPYPPLSEEVVPQPFYSGKTRPGEPAHV